MWGAIRTPRNRYSAGKQDDTYPGENDDPFKESVKDVFQNLVVLTFAYSTRNSIIP